MSGSNQAVRRSYFNDDSRELACGALVDEVWSKSPKATASG